MPSRVLTLLLVALAFVLGFLWPQAFALAQERQAKLVELGSYKLYVIVDRGKWELQFTPDPGQPHGTYSCSREGE
jgi:hypothetical protein